MNEDYTQAKLEFGNKLIDLISEQKSLAIAISSICTVLPWLLIEVSTTEAAAWESLSVVERQIRQVFAEALERKFK
jgi:hypothetical protein